MGGILHGDGILDTYDNIVKKRPEVLVLRSIRRIA